MFGINVIRAISLVRSAVENLPEHMLFTAIEANSLLHRIMDNNKYVDTSKTFGLMIPESGDWYQSPSQSPEPKGSPPPNLSPKTGPTRSPSDEETKKPSGGKRGRPRVEGDEKSATEVRCQSLARTSSTKQADALR